MKKKIEKKNERKRHGKRTGFAVVLRVEDGFDPQRSIRSGSRPVLGDALAALASPDTTKAHFHLEMTTAKQFHHRQEGKGNPTSLELTERGPQPGRHLRAPRASQSRRKGAEM
jgi:hypothetical protein